MNLIRLMFTSVIRVLVSLYKHAQGSLDAEMESVFLSERCAMEIKTALMDEMRQNAVR